jgi:non-canonical purine NTP pyrophosphatase (RdgB/HAM1 family)
MSRYNFKKIEKKWQDKWDRTGIYRAENFSPKEKFYCLIEFPYPSGAGLHTGHVRSHVAMDIVCRKKRMDGKNVLYPIGWDAFGLPTENFAIKTKKQPAIVTRENIANFTKQIKSYGPSFDWSREINTTDPEYYKWTQWIFLKLYNSFYDDALDKARPIEELPVPEGLSEIERKNYIDEHRMAYEKEMPINWCPSCKIGLANEEVIAGSCERCGSATQKKNVRQWMLRITKYSERLIRDLDTVDYLDKIKTQQINWIGKSEGAEIDFPVKIEGGSELSDNLRVFTTRPDTIFGVSYMVVAPEHPIIEKYKKIISNWNEVHAYAEEAKNKSDLDRTDLNKEKTGIELLGIKAVNPVSGELIPIWTSDYVLSGYGTGAIMAVPAHDTRDMEFALKFGMPIRSVIEPAGGKTAILIHGFEDDNNGQFSPWKDGWIKEKLADLGYEVISPDMPNSRHPKRDEWVSFLKQYENRINPNTIFIGHSLGCAAIADFVSDLAGKIKAVYLIAPANGTIDFQKLRAEWRNENSDIDSMEAFAHGKTINWSAIKEKAEIVKVILSDNDKYIPYEETKKAFEERKISCITLHEQKHFIGRRIPELYAEIARDTYIEEGIAINSHEYSGLNTAEFKKSIISRLEKEGWGKKSVNYKLRDWVFSRQHYWGEPIPIIKCKHCLADKLDVKITVNFEKEEVFRLIQNGMKTADTRALNPEEPERYFGNIKAGNLVRLRDKRSEDFEIVKITNVKIYKDLGELFEDKEILPKVFPDFKDSHDYTRLEKEYGFTANYIERINKNGLVVWEFEKIDVTQNIPLTENELPLKLPEVKNYEPTDTGESPLAGIKDWVNITCPVCGKNAKRETDTMPNWAGSSWYFLRYTDPNNNQAFADRKNLDYWTPVDLYNGGMEHTTLHLLYSRFWHKFLFDLGFVPTSEPYKARRSHGMIIAEDGQKMSKSRGNVVNPDDIIRDYGADTLRVYEMFMGPYSEAIAWNTNSLIGVHRFLERVWNLQDKVRDETTGKQKILLASNNPDKLQELRNNLANFDVIGIGDLEEKYREPEENGETFEKNSLIKAKYYAKKTNYLTIADDSGLSIKAMDGRPGVYSSRFAGGNYAKAYEQIFKELEGKDRSAFFKSVITIYDPKTDEYRQFDGICEGRIAEKTAGTNGFGYDPIFIPNGADKTFGEMAWEEKAKYDHRAKATAKLKTYLKGRMNAEEIESLRHKTIKKITEDIDDLKFNTCISQLMIMANAFEKQDEIARSHFETFILLLAPFAPHIAEELWEGLGNTGSVHTHQWPAYNPKLIRDKEIELVVQVNGKVRDKIMVSADISEEEARAIALGSSKVNRWFEGKEPKKVIVVKGKLVSIVI